ncbi:LTXXQ motif family protein [Noviherbaspirillum humi]|uniref:LTXXQ motif family protein n=1 Tax=Noviherbaspirillum humi TaxID=1688639 RepID=A0A239EWM2_9BURK|nr:Spy/CpxP family protein refolding chaperone [Noviherbaspirillum humi]SNS48841.1 LTXXQ motif family protein [Noviherbaspirillum humi]
MKSIRNPLLIVLASLAIGAGSLAAAQDSGSANQRGGANGQFGQRFQERMQKRAAELHDKLKLTPAQEPAWNAYIARMRPASQPQRPSADELNALTTPQRMERRLDMMRQHEQRMAERIAATKEFYGILSPEQKKAFDEASRHRMEHRHHG